jgi:hypothetical protein
MQAQIADLLRNQQTQSPPSSDDTDVDESGLTKLTDEYPDFAPLVNAVVKTVKTVKQTNQERLSRDAVRDAAVAQQMHRSAVLARHPDVDSIAAAPAFQAWLEAQPPMLKQVAQQGAADDVAWLLDQYKAQGKPDNSRAQALKAAAKDAVVPNLRGQSPAQRQPESNGKVPFSKVSHLSQVEMMKRYPDDAMIDWSR